MDYSAHDQPIGFYTMKDCPTKRAPDAGDSGAIPSLFLRLILFPVGRLPPPAPARVTPTVGRTAIIIH